MTNRAQIQPVRRIVLTGFMGSGKSTVGPLVAQRLGWQFIDADNIIEAEAGMKIAAIFAQFGEAGFRTREHSTIARLVEECSLVLALGGGPERVEEVQQLADGGGRGGHWLPPRWSCGRSLLR